MSFPAKATKKAPLWGSLPYLRCLPSFFPVGIRRQEQVHVARNLHFQVIFLHNALAGSRSHRAHGIRAGQQLRRHIRKHVVIPEVTQEPVFAVPDHFPDRFRIRSTRLHGRSLHVPAGARRANGPSF